jgi:hypothetical protein
LLAVIEGRSVWTRAKMAAWMGQVVVQVVNIIWMAVAWPRVRAESVVFAPSLRRRGTSGTGTGGLMRPWSLLGAAAFWLLGVWAKAFVATTREVAARECRKARRVGRFLGTTREQQIPFGNDKQR